MGEVGCLRKTERQRFNKNIEKQNNVKMKVTLLEKRDKETKEIVELLQTVQSQQTDGVPSMQYFHQRREKWLMINMKRT